MTEGREALERWDDEGGNQVVSIAITPKGRAILAVCAHSVNGPSLLEEVTQAIREAVTDFAASIEHGDGVHRQWLYDAAVAYNEGRELLPPAGKGASNDR